MSGTAQRGPDTRPPAGYAIASSASATASADRRLSPRSPRGCTPTPSSATWSCCTRCTRCCSRTRDCRRPRSARCSSIWSVTGFVLEVPSGIWADAVSRRLLLALAPLLSGAGYALWVLAPSYEAFALGFVLWGAQGALQSGALEALVYEELERDGAEDRYPRLMGRATALGTIAAGVATGLAAPVFAAGGFEAVGAASVLACARRGRGRGVAARAPARPADGRRGGGGRRGDRGARRAARVRGDRRRRRARAAAQPGAARRRPARPRRRDGLGLARRVPAAAGHRVGRGGARRPAARPPGLRRHGGRRRRSPTA